MEEATHVTLVLTPQPCILADFITMDLSSAFGKAVVPLASKPVAGECAQAMAASDEDSRAKI